MAYNNPNALGSPSGWGGVPVPPPGQAPMAFAASPQTPPIPGGAMPGQQASAQDAVWEFVKSTGLPVEEIIKFLTAKSAASAPKPAPAPSAVPGVPPAGALGTAIPTAGQRQQQFNDALKP